MASQPFTWLEQPQYFLPFFALMWVCVTSLLSLLSGWFSLAKHFRAGARVHGQRYRFASGGMGIRLFPVHYGNCLFVTVNEAGFGMSLFLPFRLLSPPLFIPWDAIETLELKRFLFFPYVVVRVRGQWPTISIRGRAGKGLQEMYAQQSS